jgi:hypothetical protein
MEKGDNLNKNKELKIMVRLVEYGTNTLDLIMKKYLILTNNFLCSYNTSHILCLRMQIGGKILSIEEEMKLQGLKIKNRDCRYCKGRTESLDKNIIKKND